MLAYGHSLEEVAVGGFGTPRTGSLKEIADHAQIQGFAETPGAGNQVYFAGIVDKILDEMGFIDKIAVFVDEFLEIRDTLGQAFLHGVECSMAQTKGIGNRNSPG